MPITCKFGGTSLVDARLVRQAHAIINGNRERRHIVVSAPGKRSPTDTKVTDLFYAWQAVANVDISSTEIRNKIEARYLDIVRGLGLELDLSREFEDIGQQLSDGASKDFAASRGEYLMGKIMSQLLGFGFVDPATCVRIDKNGLVNAFMTYDLTTQAVGRAGGACVMSGFYGTTLDGKSIKTFTRGGSDISGAILARATAAQCYENWTDVSGMLAADPRVVENPQRIQQIGYKETRELSYMGFVVIHPEALYPVEQKGIPTHILNTNAPEDEGTMIIPDSSMGESSGNVIGIAGRKGFVIINLEKALMNQVVGFGRKALEAVERHGVSFEHMPSSIDSMSIIIHKDQLENGKLAAIVGNITYDCQPDDVSIDNNLALIAFVGDGMVHAKGVAARIFKTIHEAGVNIRVINQGASERNIIVGVASEDYENTVRSVYAEFFP